MSEWVLLRNETELEAKAKTLRRKCRGHYYTNYYFLHSTRNDDLRYTEMFYREDGDNIYALERMDEFYQLFYFIGDADYIRLELPPSVERGVLTCEIDEEEGKELFWKSCTQRAFPTIRPTISMIGRAGRISGVFT